MRILTDKVYKTDGMIEFKLRVGYRQNFGHTLFYIHKTRKNAFENKSQNKTKKCKKNLSLVHPFI